MDNKTKGRVVEPRGYVLIRVGKKHHLSDVRGYAYEHRLVAEEMLRRRLRKKELVHHDDENKGNNRPSNLIPTPSQKAHHRLHAKRTDLRPIGAKNPIVHCACACGTTFRLFDELDRPRRFVPGHNPHEEPRTDLLITVLGSRTLHRAVIAMKLRAPVRRVAVMLSRLVKRGRVVRSSRGYYKNGDIDG